MNRWHAHPVVPSNLRWTPLPPWTDWDRRDPYQATPVRDYGRPRLRELLTPDPREALAFLLIVAVVLLASIVGIHP